MLPSGKVMEGCVSSNLAKLVDAMAGAVLTCHIKVRIDWQGNEELGGLAFPCPLMARLIYDRFRRRPMID
jgi:hypothetical protein